MGGRRLRSRLSGEARSRENRKIYRLGLSAIVALVPLPLGAAHHPYWALLDLAILLLTAAWVYRRVAAGRLVVRDHPLFLPVGALAALALLQWIAGSVGQRLRAEPTDLPRLSPLFPASASPWATESALLQLLAYGVLLFLVVQTVTRRHLWWVTVILAASAAIPTLYGLRQYASGTPEIFGFVNRYYPTRLFGTFINANHFATFLGMSLCLVLGTLAGFIVSRERHRFEGGRGGRLTMWIVWLGLGTVALAQGGALVLTRSRAGVMSAIVGLGFLIVRGAGASAARPWRWGLAAGWVAASLLGLWMIDPLRERMTLLLDGSWQEGRVAAWKATLQMSWAAPAFGTGLGTYRAVFPHFQQASLPPDLFQNAAHSEPLELLATTGVAGGAVAGWGIWRLVRWMVAPLRETDRFGRWVALGALAGLVVLVVHGCVDFPLRTPANAVWGVVLVGLLPAALGRAAVRQVELPLGWRGRAALGLAAAGLLVLPAAVVAGEALAERLDGTGSVADEAILSAPAGSESALRRCLVLDPQRSRYPLRLAELYAAAGYRRLRDGAPAEAFTLLGRAEGWYRQAIQLDQWRALPRARLAWLYGVADSRWPGFVAPSVRALALFNAAVVLEPHNPYPPRLLALWALDHPAGLGEGLDRERLLDVAGAASRRAVRIQPALLPELIGAALPWSLEYSDLARLVPDNPDSRLALARFLSDRSLQAADQRTAEALSAAAASAFDDAVRVAMRRRDPEALARVRAAYADSLLRHGRPADGLAQAREGKAVAGETLELAALEAEALGSLRLFDEAERAYRNTIALAVRIGRVDRRVNLLFDLARLYEKIPSPRRALAAWRELSSLSPEQGEAHAGMGRAYDALGQPRLALDEYRSAVAVSPHDAGVRTRVAEALFQRGLYHEAIDEWRTLVQRQPDDLSAHLGLAAAYERLGDADAARQQYVAVLDLAPDNPSARLALARLGGGR